MDVFISNLQDKIPVDAAVLEQMAFTVLSQLQCDSHCELSIALVDDQEIQRLNREYRGIDRNTDVYPLPCKKRKNPC